LPFQTRSFIKPGAMCPLRRSPTENEGKELVNGYSLMWGGTTKGDKRGYVEKSPQNMIKIPFLRQAFRDNNSHSRFIVILKHPATLSISFKSKLDPAYDADNFRHFMSFMTKTSINGNTFSTKSLNGSNCELGWLPGVHELYTQLNQNNTKDILVLHYEEFRVPRHVCHIIANFLSTAPTMGKQWRDKAVQKCDDMFEIKAPQYTRANDFRSRINSARNLRLHHGDIKSDNGYETTQHLWFDPRAHVSSGAERLLVFRKFLERLPVSQRNKVNALEGLLQKYGYSLNHANYEWKKDAFVTWRGK
jgi:hypothetical protein